MSDKDWIGNGRGAVFTTLGATNHADHEREKHDYYATDPRTIDELLAVEEFPGRVWEPACGEGHMSERLKANGVDVYSTDLIDRGYGDGVLDFLQCRDKVASTHIITNPPYKYGREFVERSLDLVDEGHKVAMFLKLTFLEGKERRKMFQTVPPRTVYVYSSRRKCAMNGEFDKVGSSAAAYAWFVWVKGFQGEPVIRWIA